MSWRAKKLSIFSFSLFYRNATGVSLFALIYCHFTPFLIGVTPKKIYNNMNFHSSRGKIFFERKSPNNGPEANNKTELFSPIFLGLPQLMGKILVSHVERVCIQRENL